MWFCFWKQDGLGRKEGGGGGLGGVEVVSMEGCGRRMGRGWAGMNEVNQFYFKLQL